MEFPAITEESRLGILHLNRFYAKSMAKRNGVIGSVDLREEWELDLTLLTALNLGLEQTLRYLYNEAPSLSNFEDWILEVNNQQLEAERIKRFNASVSGAASDTTDPAAVLSDADLRHWDEQGYVIIRNAISPEDCATTIKVITDFLNIDLDDPKTWYEPHPARQGIMVQLFQHAILEKNRRAPRIKAAFEQLWGHADLWETTDRVGFNPPETATWQFPGPDLHWDVSLDLPIPFGTQGILYLSDTLPNQGAFTLVPGFQHKIADWLHSLPADANPRQQNLHALGAVPIEANAGDFILWSQALPHGSSRNTATQPRIVQYINYKPLDAHERKVWR